MKLTLAIDTGDQPTPMGPVSVGVSRATAGPGYLGSAYFAAYPLAEARPTGLVVTVRIGGVGAGAQAPDLVNVEA